MSLLVSSGGGSGDVDSHNVYPAAHASGFNSFKFIGNTNYWSLRGREPAVAPGIGVPFFRSDITNSPTAFDVMPNGNPAWAETCWIDVCVQDLSPANSTNFQCAIVAARTNAVVYGSHIGGNVYSHLPCHIGGSYISLRNGAVGGDTNQHAIFASGTYKYFRSAGGTGMWLEVGNNNRQTFCGNGYVRWSDDATNAEAGSYDTSIARSAAGVVEITAGTPGGTLGTIKAGAMLQPNETTPASASATGVKGTIVWDANYLYVCTATNTWKRAALSSW